MQQIQASLLPFHLHRKTIEVPSGLTLEDYVAILFPKKVRNVDIIINIGDEVIPKSMWKSIRPKYNAIVGINAIPAGGGGKKNPLAAILSIALIVAAPYMIAALAPAIAGSMVVGVGAYTGAQFAIAQGLVRIGIALVGYLATSMLASTPSQNSGRAESAKEITTKFIEGANNKIDRYGVIPANLGTNRMFPPQAALPYTETTGKDQYVRQMFTYGFGKVIVTERRIGETLISEYEDFEMNDRLNADLVSGVSLFSNDIYQEGYSVTVSNSTGYITRTTQRDVNETEIELTFSGGLTNYDDNAVKYNASVEFEVQFAPTGTSNWSSSAANTTYSFQTFPISSDMIGRVNGGSTIYNIITLNLITGVAQAIAYTSPSEPPPIPHDNIRIASCTIKTFVNDSFWVVSEFIDERYSHIGNAIQSSSDFVPSVSGYGRYTDINISTGVINSVKWVVKDSTAEALRVIRRLIFPTKAQYDIRLRRLTADSSGERTRDVATLTAIRSIKYSSPVLQTDISGSAVRIKATDQLNGSLSTYNCIVSTMLKDYDQATNTWIDDSISSNPASIFRYVLQSPAFVKRLADNRINLEKLQEWHTYCETKNLTYNYVVESVISIDELLNNITAAGMATTHKIDGIYSVLIDNERPLIKGMVTPRNSWGYTGQINYPDIPHALRVQFRNKEKGYNTDERIVYSDGYNEFNSTLFETLDFPSCTNADLAWFYGRSYIATALLQKEIHTFNMDFENLCFNRGDKIIFVNDTILVGVGQGRISQLINNGTHVTSFKIDETVIIPASSQFGVRIRHGNGSGGYIYYSLNTTMGETDTFYFATPVLIADAPPFDSLCAFTKFGTELELIITEIMMNKDHSARIVAVNYAPERFNAATGAIPPFSSNITIPIDFHAPLAPQLAGNIQSDETVMFRNSDGSRIGRMIIPLKNLNGTMIDTIVKIRTSGATQWNNANVLSSDPNQVILTGLQDGSSYDIRIVYQRLTGKQLLSIPLIITGQVYQGASAKPADVTGFVVNASETIGLFEWNSNQDIDLSHYIIKFSKLTSGVLWVNSQLLADNILGNRFTYPIQSGTYLIKAVDILGNQSANATTIISADNGAFNNVVQLIQGQTTWTGTHSNTQNYGGELYLIDLSTIGYYYFDQFDLGDIYESILSSSLEASGAFFSRVRAMTSIRSVSSIRGTESIFPRSVASVRSLPSVRGIDPAAWSVELQMRTSNNGSTWTAWTAFKVGKYFFRYLELRLKLVSTNLNISPKVIKAEILVDMPDRYESGDNVSCPPSGAAVTYTTAFRNNPSVNITLQNAAVDDKIEFVSKTDTGFTIKVYNQTTAGYVTRSFDYHASGYGRKI